MICHVGFGGRNPRDGELFAFLETVAGGFGGRAVDGRPGRGPAASPEHRERPGRGDRDQLPGPHPALRADRGVGGPGHAPRRARPASRLHLRGRRVVHDPRRPRPLGAVRAVRRARPRRPARYILNPDTAPTTVSSKTTLSLHPGDVISIQSCGGGGYGPPDRRDPAGGPARRAGGSHLGRARGGRVPRRGRSRDRHGRRRADGGPARRDGLDGLPTRGRYRRHVHRRDPHRRGDRRLPDQQGLDHAVRSERGLPARHRPDPGARPAPTRPACATSSTARRSRPTRSSSARSPGPR